mgnify:CR=1 FL=1
MAGVVNIPWYSTLFRGDQFEVALREIAPICLRYGATGRPEQEFLAKPKGSKTIR